MRKFRKLTALVMSLAMLSSYTVSVSGNEIAAGGGDIYSDADLYDSYSYYLKAGDVNIADKEAFSELRSLSEYSEAYEGSEIKSKFEGLENRKVIEVPLEYKYNVGFYSMTLDFSSDPELTFVGLKEDIGFEDAQVVQLKNRITVVRESDKTEEIKENGVFAVLLFALPEDPSLSEYKVEISGYDAFRLNGKTTTSCTQSGYIQIGNVGDEQPGDTDTVHYSVEIGSVEENVSELKKVSDYAGKYSDGDINGDGDTVPDYDISEYNDNYVVEVPLYLNDNAGIYTGQIKFKSDLKLMGVKMVGDAYNTVGANFKVSVKRNLILFNNSSDYTGTGQIATLLFILPENYSNEYDIRLDEANPYIFNAKNPVKDAVVKVTEGKVSLKSDDNSDSVTADYGVKIGKVYMPYSELKTVAEYAGKYSDGDINGDGETVPDYDLSEYSSRKVAEVPLYLTANSGIYTGQIKFSSPDLKLMGVKMVGDAYNTVGANFKVSVKRNLILFNNSSDYTGTGQIATLLYILPEISGDSYSYSIDFDKEKPYIFNAKKPLENARVELLPGLIEGDAGTPVPAETTAVTTTVKPQTQNSGLVTTTEVPKQTTALSETKATTVTTTVTTPAPTTVTTTKAATVTTTAATTVTTPAPTTVTTTKATTVTTTAATTVTTPVPTTVTTTKATTVTTTVTTPASTTVTTTKATTVTTPVTTTAATTVTTPAPTTVTTTKATTAATTVTTPVTTTVTTAKATTAATQMPVTTKPQEDKIPSKDDPMIVSVGKITVDRKGQSGPVSAELTIDLKNNKTGFSVWQSNLKIGDGTQKFSCTGIYKSDFDGQWSVNKKQDENGILIQFISSNAHNISASDGEFALLDIEIDESVPDGEYEVTLEDTQCAVLLNKKQVKYTDEDGVYKIESGLISLTGKPEETTAVTTTATSPVTTTQATTSPVTTTQATTLPVTTTQTATLPVTTTQATTLPVTTTQATTTTVIATTSPVTTTQTATLPVTTTQTATLPVTTTQTATLPVTTTQAATSPVTTTQAATSPVTTTQAATSPVTTTQAATSPVTTTQATTPPVTTTPVTTTQKPDVTVPLSDVIIKPGTSDKYEIRTNLEDKTIVVSAEKLVMLYAHDSSVINPDSISVSVTDGNKTVDISKNLKVSGDITPVKIFDDKNMTFAYDVPVELEESGAVSSDIRKAFEGTKLRVYIVKKGDISLDNVVDTRDAAYVVQSYNEERVNDKDDLIVPSLAKNAAETAGDKENTELYKELSLFAGDASADDEVHNLDTRDASVIIQFYNESRSSEDGDDAAVWEKLGRK